MKKGSNTSKKVFKEQEVEEVLSAVPVEDEPVIEEPERVEAEVVTTGVVIADMLNIRSGPALTFNPIGTLYKGEQVEYTTENDTWVKLAGDKAGYCMKQFIQ